jgi:hypothetical protein
MLGASVTAPGSPNWRAAIVERDAKSLLVMKWDTQTQLNWERVNRFTHQPDLFRYKACVIAEVLAMTERPYWLQTDLVIIVLGLALIGAVVWIAP